MRGRRTTVVVASVLTAGCVTFGAQPKPKPEPEETLSCEQIIDVAQTVGRSRDQGQSLQQVMTQLRRDTQGRMAESDARTLENIASDVYLGRRDVQDIGVDCLAARKARAGKR